MRYVGREGNDVSSAQATECPGLHRALQRPKLAARIVPGPLGGWTDVNGWCLTCVQQQRSGMAAGAVPGFSGVGGTQVAGIN